MLSSGEVLQPASWLSILMCSHLGSWGGGLLTDVSEVASHVAVAPGLSLRAQLMGVLFAATEKT